MDCVRLLESLLLRSVAKLSNRRVPTGKEVSSYLRDRRNWGRWGEYGGAGAINLITPAKRVQAANLIRSGRTVSLGRPLPVDPAPDNPRPVSHHTTVSNGDVSGYAVDYLGIYQHGYRVTHIDALCHNWDSDGMWDGRDPLEEIDSNGASYGSVSEWSEGIVTRGVLLDVPAYRETSYVTVKDPVHGWELEEIAAKQKVTLQSGDALVVFAGRDAYAADYFDAFADGNSLPGLHASCLPFIRDHDVSLLAWDVLDATPTEYTLSNPVHAAMYAYGVAILDNCNLMSLAQACVDEGRFEFMLMVSPLVIIGGTGSPVNPIVIF